MRVEHLLVLEQVVADVLHRLELDVRALLRHEHARVVALERVEVVDVEEVPQPAVDAEQVERRRRDEVDRRLVGAEERADLGDPAQRRGLGHGGIIARARVPVHRRAPKARARVGARDGSPAQRGSRHDRRRRRRVAVAVPARQRARRRRDADDRGLPRRRARDRVRHAGAGRVRAGAARAGARVRRRARRPLAALARRVRLQGVPVHRRPARDGRGGARARRRGRRRDRHRARGGRGPGAAGAARQRQGRRRDRDGRRARHRPRRRRQRRRRRPARGDRARSTTCSCA